MTLPLVLLNRRRIGGFNPRAILAGSTAFLWLDPSDLTTLFQDAAGTTPVTAPAQPVGLVLDKSQGLVLGSEQAGTLAATGTSGYQTLTGGVWEIYRDASGSGHITTSTIFPAGRSLRVEFDYAPRAGSPSAGFFVTFPSTSGSVTYALTSGATSRRYSMVVTVGTSASELRIGMPNVGFGGLFSNISVRELPGFHATQSTAANRPTYGVVPSRGRVNILNATATLATQTRPVTAAQHTLSFRGTGTITLSGASTAGPLVGTGANDIVSLTFTPTAGNLTLTVSGTVNDAQLELGAARGTYQLVSDAAGFNITDPAGFPSYPLHYLFFGGDLDPRWLQTATITPSADKVQVFAGVRKLSDAATGMVAEHGITGTENGIWNLTAPLNNTGNSYRFASTGTSLAGAVVTGFAAPITNVLTGLGDISGDLATLRINGTQAAQSTTDQGTGNYLAYPLFIGRRGGTSLAFNGQLYGLIVRFSTANLDASLINQTERWLAQKTGVTI